MNCLWKCFNLHKILVTSEKSKFSQILLTKSDTCNL